MEVLYGYLDRHGLPMAMYSDKHSVFRVNYLDREGELAQFGRALKTLEIEPIQRAARRRRAVWSGPTGR